MLNLGAATSTSYKEPEVPAFWKSKNHYDPDILKSGFFDDAILVAEEKIDGSQFSFGLIKNQYNVPVMAYRSKNQQVFYRDYNGMFYKSVLALSAKCPSTILPEGMVFRCEFVGSKRHNNLTYNRVPSNYLVMFGAEDLHTGQSVPREVWSLIAKELDIEVVRQFGIIDTKGKTAAEIIDIASGWLKEESMLGGMVEGVVLKRLRDYVLTQDNVPIYAKIVGADYREVAKLTKPPKEKTPQDEVIKTLVDMVQKDAIFTKAVQHLLEEGRIVGSNKDIGPLITEIKKDIAEEFAATAKEVLWEWAKNQVIHGCVTGFATWYRTRLERAARNENVDDANAQPVGDCVDAVCEEDGDSATSKDLITIG